MKIPASLIDKEVRVISDIPVVNGRIDPTQIKRIDVNYLDHEIAMAKAKYPNSYMIKHLVELMNELRQDVIALRNHILWEETNEEAL